MITAVADFLRLFFVPLMWACVVAHTILGSVGVIAPERLRGMARHLTSSTTVRLLGGALMIIGTEMFVHAKMASTPALVKTLGVIIFIDGGVRLLIPMVSIIFAEWFVTLHAKWYRLLGLVAFGLAYLFYMATHLA